MAVGQVWHGTKKCAVYGAKIPRRSQVEGQPCPFCGSTLDAHFDPTAEVQSFIHQRQIRVRRGRQIGAAVLGALSLAGFAPVYLLFTTETAAQQNAAAILGPYIVLPVLAVWIAFVVVLVRLAVDTP